ncbi:MAG TPA: CAP domain-containing protein, partial [Nitrospirota bacterium]|nr:CAP domain-containing protein [Nitrospirota bacterium]
MKRSSSISTFLIIGLLLSCVSAEAGRRVRTGTPEKQPKIAVASLEKKVHARINDERRKHGLKPMEWDAALAGIARRHSQDM